MANLLPPLREDLQLKQADTDSLGRLAWIIHDPARNRFFSLDWLSSELLKRWRLRDAEQIVNSVNRETTLEIDTQDVEDLTRFLERNELVQVYSSEATDRLNGKSLRARPGFFTRLLKNYLYLRIPLLNPEPLLRLLAPLIKPLGNAWFTRLTLLALLIGLFQLGRRWESFSHSFGQIFSLESLLQVALIVVLVKLLHEFGHAFAAFNRGCRVPRMGVVFLVLFPVAYTDVTDSWKLKAQERMAIALAGIRVELMIAAWATLLWGLLPPGGTRDGVFLVLTVTWIGTLLINASPFMRFDGYFVLMDYWRIPNLHQRAAALGRWWMRNLLFGLGNPAPEYLGPEQRKLIGFAYLTWIYRLVVLGGIAWLVYELFPQPFGLLLALIELVWFILLPIAREVVQWPKLMLNSVAKPHLWLSVLLMSGAMLALLYPWRDSFSVSAVLMPEREWGVEVSEPAQIREIDLQERRVEQGELLARLESPDLDYELAKLAQEQRRLEWTLSQAGFVDSLLATGVQVQAQLSEIQQRRQSLLDKRVQLEIRAPAAGYFVPVDQPPRLLDWVSRGTALGILYADRQRVVGYMSADQRYWSEIAEPLIWRAVNRDLELAVDPIEVFDQAASHIEQPLLLRSAGGELAARRVGDGWVAEEAFYLFTADVVDPLAGSYSQSIGGIEIPARPHSYWMLFTQRLKQLVQEDFGLTF